MKDFKKSFKKESYSAGGKPVFSKPRFGGAPKRDFVAPIELYDATCAHCNKVCQVPFRPNGKKPVFCKDCFVTQNSDAAPQPRSFARAYDGEKRTNDLQAQLELINSKLDTLTRLVKGLAE